MKKAASILWDTTIYKIVCICAMILTPSYVLCFYAQPVSIVLLLWGASLLLRDLFNNRNFCKQTGSFVLILFCLGYIVTLLLYAENDLVSTLHVYCWTIVEFFLLFAIDREKNQNIEMLLHDVYKINHVISIVTFITGIASLVVFFTKTSIIMPDPEGLNNFWSMGIINGRNSGIFNNAIPCGNAMFVGCAAALYNLVVCKKSNSAVKIFYAVTFAIAVMVTMTTLTRTYTYGIYAFLFVAVFYGVYQQCMSREKGKGRAFLVAVVLGVVVTGIGVGAAEFAKWGMVKAIENVPLNTVILDAASFENLNGVVVETTAPTEITLTETVPSETVPSETVPPEIVPTETEQDLLEQATEERVIGIEEQKDYISSRFGLTGNVNLEREELDRLPNFFYPRDEMWKVALQVIPHSPIFGFTSGNRESTSVEFCPTGYRAISWPNGIPTYHNAYFDIAVSAGLLGLGLILVFLVLQIIRALKVMFAKRLDVNGDQMRFGMGVLVGYSATHVFISCMFLGVLCFNNVSVCIYFWIVLGYVSRINDLVLNDRKDCDIIERFLRRNKGK